MEHAIGEIVTLPDGRKAEVVEWDYYDCDGCVFEFEFQECKKRMDSCNRIERTDHKNIVYKEIKGDKK